MRQDFSACASSFHVGPPRTCNNIAPKSSGKSLMNLLGIDVGLRKGLDAVLLDAERRVMAAYRRLAHESLRDLVLSLEPDAVAIDSPPRWATPEGARQTEREMRRLGIQLY